MRRYDDVDPSIVSNNVTPTSSSLTTSIDYFHLLSFFFLSQVLSWTWWFPLGTNPGRNCIYPFHCRMVLGLGGRFNLCCGSFGRMLLWSSLRTPYRCRCLCHHCRSWWILSSCWVSWIYRCWFGHPPWSYDCYRRHCWFMLDLRCWCPSSHRWLPSLLNDLFRLRANTVEWSVVILRRYKNEKAQRTLFAL